jgi:NADPH-dependent ferric siderophore reductase
MTWYQAYNAIPTDERPWMRGFTLRDHDPARATIDIDFVLHDHAGPAVRWALSAAIGDTLGVFGPSTTFARPVPLSRSIAEADWVLLAGDQTALPAMSTVIEFLPAGTKAVAYIEVSGAENEQRLTTRGALTTHWCHGDTLLDAIRTAEFPPGNPFAWVAGEASVVRALRRHLLQDRGLDKRAVDFAGYWRRNLTQDDAPTDDDLAEAQERLAEYGR